MSRRLFLLLLSLAIGFATSGWCAERTVVLTSLEWPPYTGAALTRGGASGEVVRTAFESMGYVVEVRYFPWKRAVDLALHDPDVDGFYPEYASSLRSGLFLYSEAMGSSSLGFAEYAGHDFAWKRLEDLIGLRIGTVKGYVNTEPFDRMVADGKLEVDTSVNDLFNLRKVLGGRVDMAAVDVNVFRYLCLTDESLRSRAHLLKLNDRLLGINSLHVCFKRGARGRELLRVFNEGLRRISAGDVQARYLEMIFPGR
ncbi:transporter substrate-binding domain-containing protein [Pseudodesulfovibrio sp.]|uniref:substrate-binding periplasmic protein n=1 Tax=Pseudodesulfovibrio sp. TaxID=2035812 RepID=UPI002611F673|nr:transporter substrate-binding domain-containing protein [Pseudodesulfovibrio sp.]MDD3312220.1 transporter substrate-binding domain-containing protein [Pseudodesulfovibrio sp.]